VLFSLLACVMTITSVNRRQLQYSKRYLPPNNLTLQP